MAHPTQKRLPPFRGKLSAARLTDEGAHGNDAPLVRPLIRHLLCKCHLPPRGKVQRVRDAPPYMVCALRRGANCAPAGGHMGPPLRVLTDGADRRPLIRPYGPPSPQGEGKGRRRRRPPRGTAGAVLYPLCLAALDSIPTPFGLWPFPYPLCRCATSPLDKGSRPPDRGNRPSSEGAEEKTSL